MIFLKILSDEATRQITELTLCLTVAIMFSCYYWQLCGATCSRVTTAMLREYAKSALNVRYMNFSVSVFCYEIITFHFILSPNCSVPEKREHLLQVTIQIHLYLWEHTCILPPPFSQDAFSPTEPTQTNSHLKSPEWQHRICSISGTWLLCAVQHDLRNMWILHEASSATTSSQKKSLMEQPSIWEAAWIRESE